MDVLILYAKSAASCTCLVGPAPSGPSERGKATVQQSSLTVLMSSSFVLCRFLGIDTMSPVSRLVQSTSGVPLLNNVVCSYAHEKDCTALMQMRVAVLTDTEPCYVHSSHPLAVLHSLLWQPRGGLHSLES